MAKFKVGDKVIAKKHTPYSITTNGWRGVVIRADNANGMMQVKGQGSLTSGGFPVKSKYFDLDTSCNQKIVITTDGKTTTAALYDGKQRIKDAKATCAPDDEFDFERGALIAFSRLTDCDYRLADEFDWKKFKAGELFVHCTKDNYDEFIAEAKKQGCRFHNGDSPNPFTDYEAIWFRRFYKSFNDDVLPDDEIILSFKDDELELVMDTPEKIEIFKW